MESLEYSLYSPDVPFTKYYFNNNTRYFHLTSEPIKYNILSNLSIDAFGYNCSTPGPVIVIKQDEWINITVENRLDTPTALHVHGHDFTVVSVDGFSRLEYDDTIDVASGRRIEIE